jgi:hypothetical protein
VEAATPASRLRTAAQTDGRRKQSSNFECLRDSTPGTQQLRLKNRDSTINKNMGAAGFRRGRCLSLMA